MSNGGKDGEEGGGGGERRGGEFHGDRNSIKKSSLSRCEPCIRDRTIWSPASYIQVKRGDKILQDVNRGT